MLDRVVDALESFVATFDPASPLYDCRSMAIRHAPEVLTMVQVARGIDRSEIARVAFDRYPLDYALNDAVRRSTFVRDMAQEPMVPTPVTLTCRAETVSTNEPNIVRYYQLPGIVLVPTLYSTWYLKSPWANMTRGLALQLEESGCRPASVRILMSRMMSEGQRLSEIAFSHLGRSEEWSFEYDSESCLISRRGNDTQWDLSVRFYVEAHPLQTGDYVSRPHRLTIVSKDDLGWDIAKDRPGFDSCDASATFRDLGIGENTNQ